jgi:uncharacterized protein (TIGR03437 family)
MLRLVSSTVGPLAIATGSSAASRTVEAYNAGDGSLALTVASSVPWITGTVGSARACATTTDSQSCIPIQLAISPSGLPAGLSTGVITVSDPKAIDAPQTITVTVRLGGVDVHVAPGGTRDVPVATGSMVSSQVKTQDGNPWLTLVLDGTGSFRFSFPYRIHLQPPDSMSEGAYSGSVSTSGGAAADTLAIPVTMRVTTQPIAAATPDSLAVRLAQGAPATAAAVGISNLGHGSLTVGSVSATGSGVTASSSGSTVVAGFDAGSLAPGVYNGSLSVATNAVTGTVAIPVSFEVVAKGAPLIRYQGVVDNGTFGAGDTAARGDVMVVLGEQLSFEKLTVGKAPPLDTSVGGATILVNGKPAPMYYSSYGQLAFQMPVDAPLGTNLVQVQRDSLTSNTVSVNVADRAPRLLLIGTTGYGAVQNAADYSLPMPEGMIPGVLTHPAKPGDTLIVYAIGLGPTSPAVATGAPAPAAEPFARLTEDPDISFGTAPFGASVKPSFAGLSPTFAGLYQLNVTIPPETPRGNVVLQIGFSDSRSNAVLIAIE